MSVEAKATRVRLLLFDVDGVLTDGHIDVRSDGSESKRFHIRDGAAIVWARRAGLLTGILSVRMSAATTARARQLDIPIVAQGVAVKLDAYDEILETHGLTDADVAYMGDDLLDLPVLSRAGLSSAPADAAQDVRAQVDWVSSAGGGEGAVRELIELVLKARGMWPPAFEAPDAPTGSAHG